MKFLNRIFLTAIFAVAGFAAATAEQLIDASTLRVINRGWDNCHLAFSRLPSSFQNSFNTSAWACSMHSAGVAVRFATNSRTIGVKYSLWANSHMNHQAPTGTKGMDLYILNEGKEWRHVNTIRPEDRKNQEGDFNVNLDGSMHEFMIYLPLYDGVTEMFVKIDDGATITKGNFDAIDPTKKVVMYGTSILQGGCASRTGMSPTAILSRWLNAEVINLGFSGGGKMEQTAAEKIAQIPNVSAFVIDPVPNCDDIMCRDLTYNFVKTIRDANPGVPVIMVEGPMYPYSWHNSYFKEYLPLKNKYFHDNYLKLLEDNPANLYYVTCENLDGVDDDGTIDGIHLSDLGFKYYAEKLLPELQPFATGTTLMTITSHQDGAADVPLGTTFEWSRPERVGTLQISTTASFSSNGLVYQAEGTGSAVVPETALAASTRYYARVGYVSPGAEEGNVSYTPSVSFTTESADVTVPELLKPVDGGILYADQRLAVKPLRGASNVRIEVSAATTFPSRSSYILTLPTGHFEDTKTASEIKLGGSALKEGATYYARARSTYNTADGSVNTEFSPVVKFTYSPSTGVDAVAAGEAPVKTEHYDLTGRKLDNPAPGQAVLTVSKSADGRTSASKTLK
ncbi:MAG: SGNH/GDSL hydrolase family protein [Muribaculaceae bacterium]|nr:SGNH/GDSL hydrolase family protein [Muribaculaceae bacterium]